MENNSVVRLDASNYKDYIKTLSDILMKVTAGDPLGLILKSLKDLMYKYSVAAPDSYSDIVGSLGLMTEFLLKGYADEHREELYNQLSSRVYRLIMNLSLEAKLKFDSLASYLPSRGDSSIDIGDLKEKLESFVSDIALLSLEPEGESSEKGLSLYENRQTTISKAFIDVIRSGQWSKEQCNDMTSLLLSPTIDTIDAQVLCSALLMATLLSPDPYKVSTMIKVYKSSTDSRIRQRSLVGWVLAYDAYDYEFFRSVQDDVHALLKDEKVRNEIAELQMQMVYCISTEQDNETIRKDVMPTIIKNQNLEITRFGIKEKEEDSMDDILNSDEADKKMEEMEKTVQKMADMQKSGVDIYFGGFSKMKRFGFFYTLCNWFMPFYANHPGLKHLSKNLLSSGFMKGLMENGPFCDSDKYSFALGMSSVYERLPENIRELLSNSDDLRILGDSGADVSAPAYIRRFYLQDLYRFFKISDARTLFKNPFSNEDGHLFMENMEYKDSLHSEAQRVSRFLIKRKQYAEAIKLLKVYDSNDVNDIFLKAQIYLCRHRYKEARFHFKYLLDNGRNDLPTLKGAALAFFYNGNFGDSARLYRRLSESFPDKTLYKLNLAISLLNDNKAEEGVNVLYELYYKQPDDLNVKRALAWGFLLLKKVEKAQKLYDEILGATSKEAADYLNAGYCAWFEGNLKKALDLFREYTKVEKSIDSNIFEKFSGDHVIFELYNISEVDQMLVAGMV